MSRTNCQSDMFDLDSQSEKDEEDRFLLDGLIDNSSDKYINQFIDNHSSHLDLPTPTISMEDNLGDEHNQIDFRALSEYQ